VSSAGGTRPVRSPSRYGSATRWFIDQLRDVAEAEDREETTLTEVMAELRAIRAENAQLHARVDQLMATRLAGD
jgi:hypothetical protein